MPIGTWTYSPDEVQDRDKVRAMIGDVDTNDQQVTDQAIAEAITTEGNIYLAGSRLCLNLAARYARRQNIRIDGFSVDNKGRADHYRALAVQLKSDADTLGGAGQLGAPIVTGISEAAMETAQLDTDRPKPFFEKGGMNVPGLKPPERAVNDETS